MYLEGFNSECEIKRVARKENVVENLWSINICGPKNFLVQRNLYPKQFLVPTRLESKVFSFEWLCTSPSPISIDGYAGPGILFFVFNSNLPEG